MAEPYDWNDIKALIAAAEAGSLSGAAAATGVSQPTLGRRIDALEKALGLTLFSRGPQGMVLTQSGADILAHARTMEDAAARLSIAASGKSETLTGVVRISASEVISAHHLPAIIARLIEAEPEVEVELIASDQSDNLLRHEADIAIRMYRPQQADLIAKKVNEMALGLYASHAYLAAYGTPTQNVFDGHRMIGYDKNPAFKDWIDGEGVFVPKGFLRMRTDNQLVYWQMVLAGVGIGVSQRSIGDHEPGVQRVLEDQNLPPLPVWLTVHKELRTSALIRRVYDFLAEELAIIG